MKGSTTFGVLAGRREPIWAALFWALVSRPHLTNADALPAKVRALDDEVTSEL